MDECLVVGSPVGEFERLFCHVMSLQDQECGDLILTTIKSSIYSTKPLRVLKYCGNRYEPSCFLAWVSGYISSIRNV